ncbi:MAG: hypothetical protein ABR613_11375 [Actinomycetota bacterium]
MRKLWVVALAGVMVGASALVVWGAGARGRGDVDARVHAWTDDAATTTSGDWAGLPGLTARTRCQGNDSASATVSLELGAQSDPVEVRVVMDALDLASAEGEIEGLLNPGAVEFAGEGASSYTFVGRTPTKGGSIFEVQWRLDPDAPGAQSATLESGTLDVLWKKQAGRGGLVC